MLTGATVMDKDDQLETLMRTPTTAPINASAPNARKLE